MANSNRQREKRGLDCVDLLANVIREH